MKYNYRDNMFFRMSNAMQTGTGTMRLHGTVYSLQHASIQFTILIKLISSWLDNAYFSYFVYDRFILSDWLARFLFTFHEKGMHFMD